MATPKFNSKSPTIRRILREAQELSSSPSADYTAVPLENDLFEWHFTLKGPPSSAFAGGIYHGRIVLPAMYPLRPPSFRFVTPSGRFETNREICLSISGHHEETWQPAWGVRTALVALRSFMETDPKGQLGGLETTDEIRRRLATESKGFRCSVCAKTNGEIMEECEKAAQEYEAASGGSGSSKASAEEVPSELKLAWRDELEGAASKKADGSGAATTTPPTTNTTPAPITQPAPTEQIQIRPAQQNAEDSETDELAEGFVPTDPLDSISRYDGVRAPRRRAVFTQQSEASSSSQEQQRQPGVPPRGPPQLTPPFPIPPSRVNPQQIPAMMIQRQQERIQRERQAAAAASYREDPINVWVDRLIVILGVLLAALILKVLLF
ncbi:Ubiquitin-conjugating enzyme/RWD-like protein [Rhypophila sp. PSN 637]